MKFTSISHSPILFSLITMLGLSSSSGSMARLPRLSAREISQRVSCQTTPKPATCQRIVRRHLIRDLKGCQIDPDRVEELPQLMQHHNLDSVRVHGRSAFLGFVPAPYSYTGKISKDGTVIIKANVYFTNHKRVDQATKDSMQVKLDQAADKWSRNNPYNFPVRFVFKLTEKRKDSDVRARLKQNGYTRGPYFSTWTTSWGANTIAHEMGHVMGLDDEYSNTPFRSMTYCDRSSIMCTSGTPYTYHYYLILKRLLCKI